MPSPTVTAYLERLPAGIDSYPDAVVKASVIRSSLERLPGGPLARSGLPTFDRIMADPPGVNEWVPQVVHCALLAAIFDQYFSAAGGRSEYEKWVYARNRQLFAAPLYRVLFAVAGPKRLFVGMTNRWRAFRRGTSAELLVNEPGHARIRVTYPPHLMEGLTLLGLREAVRASCDASGGRALALTYDEVSATETIFEIRYRNRTEDEST